MTRENIKALSRIYNNLKSGKKYVQHYKGRTPGDDFDWYILYPVYDEIHKKRFIGWSHYGSSANSFNYKSLRWIFEKIFDELTPLEFENKYILRG